MWTPNILLLIYTNFRHALDPLLCFDTLAWVGANWVGSHGHLMSCRGLTVLNFLQTSPVKQLGELYAYTHRPEGKTTFPYEVTSSCYAQCSIPALRTSLRSRNGQRISLIRGEPWMWTVALTVRLALRYKRPILRLSSSVAFLDDAPSRGCSFGFWDGLSGRPGNWTFGRATHRQ